MVSIKRIDMDLYILLVQDVLVLGAGPIGLLAMQIARSMGCTRTIIADMNPSRLELALKMGADVCIGEYSIIN